MQISVGNDMQIRSAGFVKFFNNIQKFSFAFVIIYKNFIISLTEFYNKKYKI